MSLKRKHASSSPPTGPPPLDLDAADSIFTSEALHDRLSIFQAYFSPSAAASSLQSHPDIASATHRMLATRLPSTAQKTLSGGPIIKTSTDDDGEKYGAKRALSVLEAEKVTGSIVVARWYGGVMLGPVRFTHIETVSREAIAAWRTRDAERRAEEARARDEAVEKARLVTELRQRDQSILALRGLLDVKTGNVKTGEESVKKAVLDYDGMPLQRLRMLDKARDSTIAFLLKQIDAAEKATKSSDNQAKVDEQVSDESVTENQASLPKDGDGGASTSKVED